MKKKYRKIIYIFTKSINDINFNNFNPNNSIILLIGIFHHLDDTTIKIFFLKLKFKIISIDAVILPGQSIITRLLFYLDKGNFIGKLKDYKKF